MESTTGLLRQYSLPLALLAVSSYIVSICIYRRFFHPLAKVPGPFLASVTRLYQSYYNRRFYKQTEKLHHKYGPVIRISPNEVHLADPANHDKIFHVGSKFYKDGNFYNSLFVRDSSFGTLPNDIHRIKRGALNPMFSRQRLLDLEEIVQEKAGKVVQRVQERIDQGMPADLHHAYRALSLDVTSDFAFDACYNFLDQEDLGAEFIALAQGIGPAFWIFQQFPMFQRLAAKIPFWMAPYLSKALAAVLGLQKECIRQIEGVKEKIRQGKELRRNNVFSILLSVEDKPAGYQVPTTSELTDEAYSLVAASSETVGNAITVATFNVMQNGAIYEKLAAELEQKFPDPTSRMPYLELEKLPYLTAVIKESLRLSFGILSRLPRVVPDDGRVFNGYAIPKGSIVSMSAWLMHTDPSVYSDPLRFDPDRWMQGEKEFRRLDRNMVPFSRGPRQCIGMPLAYQEMYIMLSHLFRHFPRGLKPWKTTAETMTDLDDYFNIGYNVKRKGEWLQAYMESSTKQA